jgi:hypothetical protein
MWEATHLQKLLNVNFFDVFKPRDKHELKVLHLSENKVPSAQEQVGGKVNSGIMDAVAEGDYEEASQSIYGTPDLGVGREAADHVGILIWDAFEGSVTYELLGECYTTDQGLAQDVTITCLDIASVTTNLKERSQTLLEQRVAEAADVSEIYDENNDYREDFVMEVLHDAVVDALEEDARNMTMELTVNLSYRDGKWWVVADEALLNAISGGILY